MQRIAPNTVPPRQGGNDRNGNTNAGGSPALIMARRIRSEQGVERTRQYLIAMEPYIAPAERAHIAQQLGIQLPAHAEKTEPQSVPQSNTTGFQMPGSSNGGMPNFGNMNTNAMPNFGNMNTNAMPNLGNMGGGNLQQMMQMMNAFGGLQGGKGKMDPMTMAQMFGSLMGKK